MNIPKLAERREAARLWTAWKEAEKAMEALDEKANDESNPICQRYDELQDKARDEYHSKIEELQRQCYAELGALEVRAKLKQAEDALEKYPEAVRNDGEKIITCGKSGEPVLESERPLWDDSFQICFIPEACGVSLPETKDDALDDAA